MVLGDERRRQGQRRFVVGATADQQGLVKALWSIERLICSREVRMLNRCALSSRVVYGCRDPIMA